NVGNNQIGEEGARELSKLSKLTSLNVYINQIGVEGARELAKLSNLTSLNVRNNQLGDEGARELAKLSKLVKLDIRKNAISVFPLEAYQTLLLGSLRELWLSDNPIQNLTLGDFDDIQALRGLAESLRVPNEVEPSRHLKISLLGDGEVGKTSFADYLILKRYRRKRKRTHGILQHVWPFAGGHEAQLWDFGGQDFYHGTHHLFLREENLYVVLWHPKLNPRPDEKDQPPMLDSSDERSRYGYWLGNTRYFAREAPLLLVQNKGDGAAKVQIAPEDLRTYGVSPENVFYLSVQEAAAGQPTWKRHWDYFIATLEEKARHLAAKRLVNKNWVAVRETVQAEAKKPSYLGEEAFRKKYFPNGDPNQFPGLLSYLEFSGTVIRFPEIPALQNRVYLDPKALTESIYTVFDKKVQTGGKGRFNRQHLVGKVGIEAEAHLELMNAYDLVFEAPDQPGEYVVPQYLPDYPSVYGLEALGQSIPLSFALYYPDYLHQGLIFAFIAQYGRQAIKRDYWRYGMLFEDTETSTKCLVRCDLPARRVYVHLDDTRDRLKLADRLFGYFAGIDEGNSYQKSRKAPTSERREDNPSQKQRNWERMPPRLAISVDGKQFMDVRGVRDNLKNGIFWGFTLAEQKRLPLNATLHYLLNINSTATMPKKIFLSYSHKDETYKQELDTHLAALKRSGKIEAWHDRKILPGEDWDEAILEQLKAADIVLLLLSADFMNSDYICKKEIKTAHEQQGKKTTSIVPIFLRPCDFDLPELSAKQGLPRDARWIVSNDRPNRDEGYLQVVNDLKKLL
ncbi:MAG: TIR domain-containing protein, partial [Cytophagaceae bacterium]|nr:TIR domain-containing protein [Cytophagaceae bacterium]